MRKKTAARIIEYYYATRLYEQEPFKSDDNLILTTKGVMMVYNSTRFQIWHLKKEWEVLKQAVGWELSYRWQKVKNLFQKNQ